VPSQSPGNGLPSHNKLNTNTTTNTSPGQTKEQRPFRGFDISSLIHKDEDDVVKKEERRSPIPSPTTSPKLSYGPPMERSSNPYSNIFNSNLYQQYLGQILSQQQQQQPPFQHPPSLPPAFNPMLLQAHLLAAQAHHNPLLSNYNGIASSIMAERMKQHRYSPYSSPVSSTLNTSASSSMGSPPPHPGGNGSAFRSLTPRVGGGSGSPPVSPPHSTTPPAMSSPSPSHSPVSLHNNSHHSFNGLRAPGSPSLVTVKPESPIPLARSPVGSSSGGSPLPPALHLPLPPKSDIKSIEKMISGLNGVAANGGEGRFGLAHDSRYCI
jgi:hypothetical protein